jgi:choline dehydrogenase
MEWQTDPAHVPDHRPVFAISAIVRGCSDQCGEGDWDIHVLPWLDDGDDGWKTTAVVYLLKPDSRGTVSLRSRDPRDAPVIDHGFLAEEHDVARLESGVRMMRRLAAEAGAGPELRPGPETALAPYLRREVRGIFHPTGTCAIGAVVDPSGAVFGIDGLVVADASIMPTIPRANTNLSTIAVAERIADWLTT